MISRATADGPSAPLEQKGQNMKFHTRSSLVAIAFTLVANVSLAHAATMPAHHGHRPAQMGMQAKAMLMIKQLSSSFGGGASPMSGNFDMTSLMSQMQR